MEKQILNQYKASFRMLTSCIEQYDEKVWFDKENYDMPAYEISYHVIYCANMYCAPGEEEIIHWSGEADPKKYLFGTKEMINFISHSLQQFPAYLEKLAINEKCWPHWYDLPQLEFHFNNIRHIQHHTAQLIERHRLTKRLKMKWYSFK